MDLRAVHAFDVRPARTAATPPVPSGGRLPSPDTLGEVLETARKSAERRWTEVSFTVATEPERRNEHPVRDELVRLAFGTDAEADAAAAALAVRLAESMDDRSTECLLVMATAHQDSTREVSIWTFPRDPSLRLSASQAGPTVELINDAFSRSSHLRKAALVRGQDVRTDLLTAQVADQQANATDRAVADFWIKRFLGAELSTTATQGTRLLARALREAYEATSDDDELVEMNGAISALRQSQARRWSMRSFADAFLAGAVKERFLATRSARNAPDQMFDLDRDELDRIINFRVFRLDNGAFVSAPYFEADEVLDIDEGADGRTLTVRGKIVSERVRSRHA